MKRIDDRSEKSGDLVGYNGHKKMKGTRERYTQRAVSEEGLPLSLGLSAGKEHDSQGFIDLRGLVNKQND
ncbi:hypothetical protein DRN97_10280 [Methanosarcinales archaeon]|nr:MAG: hypothetical protein DRN97_10280 [Methanosarcinales archaeon]